MLVNQVHLKIKFLASHCDYISNFSKLRFLAIEISITRSQQVRRNEGFCLARLPIRHVRRGRLSLGSPLLSFLGEKKVVRHVASFCRLFITGERFIFSWFYTLFRDTVDASRGCIHGVLNIEW